MKGWVQGTNRGNLWEVVDVGGGGVCVFIYNIIIILITEKPHSSSVVWRAAAYYTSEASGTNGHLTLSSRHRQAQEQQRGQDANGRL